MPTSSSKWNVSPRTSSGSLSRSPALRTERSRSTLKTVTRSPISITHGQSMGASEYFSQTTASVPYEWIVDAELADVMAREADFAAPPSHVRSTLRAESFNITAATGVHGPF